MVRVIRVSIAVIAAAGLIVPRAAAGVANAGITGASPTDPIAGLPWGNYSGPLDEVFPSYRRARGEQRRLLGLIALRPRARWFGAWYADDQITATVQQYIANVTGGRSDVLVQMAVFRMVPWESEACHRLPSPAEQASYRRWIDGFAAGIGAARVALILQPDLPFAQCAPGHSGLPLELVRYAAQTLSALPHTTVYIDAGAADWPTVAQAESLLERAGVADTRGFALDATHYDSTARQIAFGAAIVRGLARRGIPGRRFVINTAENGRPFTYQQYHGPDYANAPVCPNARSRRCVTLGIPPTWRVGARRWGLSRRMRSAARRLVDGYLWFGRPWLRDQADPFDLSRALALARTTPFRG